MKNAKCKMKNEKAERRILIHFTFCILHFAFCILPSIAAADAPSSDSGAGLIIFSSNRSGPWRIWSVRPDGSSLREFTLAGRRAGRRSRLQPGWGADPLHFDPRRHGGHLEDAARGRPAGAALRRRSGRMVARRPGSSFGASSSFLPAIGYRSRDARSRRRLAALLRPGLEPGRQADRFRLPLGRGERHLSRSRPPAASPNGLRPARGLRAALVTRRHAAGLRDRGPHLTIGPDGKKNRPVTYFGGVQRYGRFSPDGPLDRLLPG